jgi:hypothetical protein
MVYLVVRGLLRHVALAAAGRNFEARVVRCAKSRFSKKLKISYTLSAWLLAVQERLNISHKRAVYSKSTPKSACLKTEYLSNLWIIVHKDQNISF